MNLYNNLSLVEPGMKYFINNTLNQCRLLKDKYINFFYNLSLFVIFSVFLSLFLYYRYKSKLSKVDKEKQENDKKKFLMSKITNYKLQNNKNSITNLPEFSYY
tara:strand:+ start:12334 stop:12642 length:309 start_codon:yes stop_codon:yes gene_type:complete